MSQKVKLPDNCVHDCFHQCIHQFSILHPDSWLCFSVLPNPIGAGPFRCYKNRMKKYDRCETKCIKKCQK